MMPRINPVGTWVVEREVVLDAERLNLVTGVFEGSGCSQHFSTSILSNIGDVESQGWGCCNLLLGCYLLVGEPTL